ncbi:FecR family protein [Acidisoma cellulosilytica]|uniref:FecR family protein n=1 Tax=Acidisoma cellulosilyticum TaxID=2802395 RepID=A0A963Z7R1_9PROT|nr:FecR family protein [Acidisoma cellulosilyticum]MCB8883595.1 FecR family protein [Acidisoma cellulosilyticum]
MTAREDDRLFAEANGWFHRLRADDVTDADRAAFDLWLSQGPAQRSAWDEVQALVSAVRVPAGAVRDALTLHAYSQMSGRQTAGLGRARWGRRIGLALAAAVALVAIVGGVTEAPVFYDRLTADYATGIGDRRTVTLADGSQIELNTDTALRVNLRDGHRSLTLLRGEAWFDVMHDSAHPFTVTAAGGQTRDIGTRFSVAMRGGVTAVEVDAGLVAVTDAGARDKAQVAADQAVDYSAAGISGVYAIDPTVAFAWRQGQIVFRQQPLSKVVAELNRYRVGRIVILDSRAANRVVSGTFEIDQPAAILDALQKTLGIRVTAITPYLVLLH